MIPELGLSHSARLRAAVARYGEREFAERCAALLAGGDEEPEFLEYLGGRASSGAIDGSWPRYWQRSWGARALEYSWAPGAAASVLQGLGDEAWRVRLVCARVCAIRELGEPELLAGLLGDDNWRVRDAAAWALGRSGEYEHAAALREALDDPEPKVAARAERALAELAARLDREVR
ncbi:MAG: HEAT repeat domain-containing protein [Actinobacteria bacterium]|nr:HEAT repeat domain-containing protein [Actinomycetota bacterium]